MSIQRFRPEIWSAVLLEALTTSLVFASDAVVNRDHEGEISAMGDVVHISSIGDPTISSYTAGGTITYEDLQDAGQTMPIDQAKSFAFKVDDIDKRQSVNGGVVMSTAMKRAAYRVAKVVDQYVAGLYTGVQSANAITTTAVTTGDIAYNSLVDLAVKLDDADVPDVDRYAIVPNWYHGLLQKNANFINAEKSADGGKALRRGYIGQAAGFDIYKSNNCINVTGDDYIVQAGINDAISHAEQIVETEALRLQTTFADAVRGLTVWGTKLVRPDCIATLTASKT